MAKKTTTTKSTPGFDAPQSRNEAILQNILGASNVLGAPQSRIEALLMAILEQGGGGGGAAVLYTEQDLTDAQKAQARTNIDAVSLDDIGTVFTLKGSVATVADLPATDNHVGDVYYVDAVSAGYIWMENTEHPTGYWEEIGETIDLSAYEQKPDVQTPTGGVVSITPADNTIYKCGYLTSLTVSNPPATGTYTIVFTSGSTATSILGLTTVLGLENFTPETNTVYEINVMDNRAAVGSWAVSA